MRGHLATRIAQIIPTLLLVSVLVFGLQQLMPGDPALVLAGEEGANQQLLAQIRSELWLDRPLPVQYVHWMGNVLQGNLGFSWRIRQPVSQLIAQKLPVTLQLGIMAFAIAILIGVPTGIIAAVYRNRFLDYLANAIGLAGLSTPTFWLGIMLILLVSVDLGWLPPSGYVSLAEDWRQSLATTIMPAFVLGNAIAAVLMRHTRSAMLTSLDQDYVRTARAKGLREFVVVIHHALRNALIPVVTLGALELGTLFSGAVLTEQVFSIPGFGKMIVDAVFNRDYPVVQGVVLVTAFLYVVLNLLADVLYVVINPRLEGLHEHRARHPDDFPRRRRAAESGTARPAALRAPARGGRRPCGHRAVHRRGDSRAADRTIRSDRHILDRDPQGTVDGALDGHRRERARRAQRA